MERFLIHPQTWGRIQTNLGMPREQMTTANIADTFLRLEPLAMQDWERELNGNPAARYWQPRVMGIQWGDKELHEVIIHRHNQVRLVEDDKGLHVYPLFSLLVHFYPKVILCEGREYPLDGLLEYRVAIPQALNFEPGVSLSPVAKVDVQYRTFRAKAFGVPFPITTLAVDLLEKMKLAAQAKEFVLEGKAQEEIL